MEKQDRQAQVPTREMHKMTKTFCSPISFRNRCSKICLPKTEASNAPVSKCCVPSECLPCSLKVVSCPIPPNQKKFMIPRTAKKWRSPLSKESCPTNKLSNPAQLTIH